MIVYVNGMKMPTNCCACPLFKSNMSKQLFCKVFGAFDRKEYDKLPFERVKNCPLVPVPEHGDLIDRDKLEQDIERYIGGEESRTRFHHWVQVQNAVISRDKETEV